MVCLRKVIRDFKLLIVDNRWPSVSTFREELEYETSDFCQQRNTEQSCLVICTSAQTCMQVGLHRFAFTLPPGPAINLVRFVAIVATEWFVGNHDRVFLSYLNYSETRSDTSWSIGFTELRECQCNQRFQRFGAPLASWYNWDRNFCVLMNPPLREPIPCFELTSSAR